MKPNSVRQCAIAVVNRDCEIIELLKASPAIVGYTALQELSTEARDRLHVFLGGWVAAHQHTL